jgi:hypothetical protein
MNLLNFIEQYPDEQSCIARFKAQRDQNGVICPKCGSREHYWLATNQLAKLYDESGQVEKAMAVAHDLLNKDVKVQSTAVNEIREEMRKIIEKNNL